MNVPILRYRVMNFLQYNYRYVLIAGEHWKHRPCHWSCNIPTYRVSEGNSSISFNYEFNESIVGKYKINKIIIGHLCRNTSEQLPKQNKIHICKTLKQTTIEKWLLCTWFFNAGDHTRKLPTKVEFMIGISESDLEFPCTCGGLRWKIHLWSCGLSVHNYNISIFSYLFNHFNVVS